MKWIRIILFLFLCSCVRETEYNKNNYYVINDLDKGTVILKYWANGIPTNFEVKQKEKKLIEYPSGIITLVPTVSSFSYLRSTDSIQVVFADGKIKTDRKSEVGTDARNMYDNNLYTRQSCAKNCEEFIYTINEQDYAEAK